MSTQCFMSHVCKHPGRFAFTVFVGALLALQCLLPCTAFARSKGEQTATISPSMQQANYLRDKVGVSVVRLEITFGDTGGQYSLSYKSFYLSKLGADGCQSVRSATGQLWRIE